jgi:hypothetical protein
MAPSVAHSVNRALAPLKTEETLVTSSLTGEDR